MDLIRLTAGGGALQTLDKKDDGPSAIASVLKFLKYTPEQIDRIEKFIGTVAKVAGAVSWVFGAVTSIKDVLTSLGVLEEDDKAAKLQQDRRQGSTPFQISARDRPQAAIRAGEWAC